jgi:predicted helicase
LFGKREIKYDFLSDNSLKNIDFKKLPNIEPDYFFVPKNFNEEKKYLVGFAVTELFPFKTSGIKTHDDKNLVANNVSELKNNLANLNYDFESSKVFQYSYRPFDKGVIYYDTKLLGRAREKTIYHLKSENIALILVAQPQAANLNYFDCLYLTNCLTDTNMYRRGGPSSFPLYLYPKENGQLSTGETQERIPNLNPEIVAKIAMQLGLTFAPEKEPEGNVCMANNDEVRPEFRQHFAPIDILDYIYAVLHSPSYREKYKEFLKIDFPKIPYPKDSKTFWELVELGSQIRQIHLLESLKVEEYITEFNIDGDCVVSKPSFVKVQNFDKAETGNVFINETQCFENVPEIAWNFYIGGYQPAQKWLKDRKERKLEFEDIAHYQKIIVALTETHRLMQEIDKIEIE